MRLHQLSVPGAEVAKCLPGHQMVHLVESKLPTNSGTAAQGTASVLVLKSDALTASRPSTHHACRHVRRPPRACSAELAEFMGIIVMLYAQLPRGVSQNQQSW